MDDLDDRVSRLEAQLRHTRRLFAATLVLGGAGIVFASCKSAPAPLTKLDLFSDDKHLVLDANGLTLTSGVGDKKRSTLIEAGDAHFSHTVVITPEAKKAPVLTLESTKVELAGAEVRTGSDGLSGPFGPGPNVALTLGDREARLEMSVLAAKARMNVVNHSAMAGLQGDMAIFRASGKAGSMYANALEESSCVIVDSARLPKPEHAALCAPKSTLAHLDETYLGLGK